MSVLFVLSGPSGAGKSVLISSLMDELPGLRFSVSSTTRPPRPGETDGVDYHFLSREQFEAGLAAGRFYEHAQFSGNFYGTGVAEFEAAETDRQDLLLDIEVQGARQLLEKGVDAVTIFVVPPSFDELERRLRSRKTEEEAAIQRRLRQAVADVSQLHLYQYVIINNSLSEAAEQLKAIVIAERARRSRMAEALDPVLASFHSAKIEK